MVKFLVKKTTDKNGEEVAKEEEEEEEEEVGQDADTVCENRRSERTRRKDDGKHDPTKNKESKMV